MRCRTWTTPICRDWKLSAASWPVCPRQPISRRSRSIRPPCPERRWSWRVKRWLDIAGAALLLVCLSPIIVLAMSAILVSSGRPVLHLAKRWGRNDRQFICYKLRTMRRDGDAVLKAHGLATRGANGETLTYDRDPRIGPLGRLLRRLSIDELPQLINVLRGDMSLIGPRALVISMLADLPDIRHARSVVRPGLTGLWQVRARRKNVSVFDMIDDDLEYIRTFSLWLDLRIALLTISRIVGP
ncbi:sugar transferase [Paraburkholderia sp. RAU2J]|uniref:sugar transferase n=1 Tax=Paraburkholderia sp. RAU2J TaxID=1938810 RepID=UPI001F546B1A|nr:sugar transferase [Paraburkholderia sp. RAU2J]